MANYNNLISAIQSVITQNGNNEITGNLLQQTLVAMIGALGGGYQFGGIATPETTPGTPDEKIFYLGSSGTYPNFGPAVIPSGNMGVFFYDTSWHVGTIAFPIGEGTITRTNLATTLENAIFAFGFKLMGIATPQTVVNAPNQNVCYIGAPGTYTNFGSTKVVDAGYLGIFSYANGVWSLGTIAVGKDYDDIIDELYTDINGSEEPIVISIPGSSLASCGGTIRSSDKKWIQDTNYYGAIIPVSEYRGNNLKIYRNNNQNHIDYTFLTAGPSWGNLAQFATGYNQVLQSNTDITLTVPDNAVYLYVYMASMSTIFTPSKIDITTNEYVGGLKNEIATIQKEIDGIQQTILGTSLASCGGTIRASDNLWIQDANYYGAIVPVNDYQGGKMRIYKNLNGNVINYAFLTAGPSWNTTPLYATGYTKVQSSINDIDLDIPDDAEYLYVYLNSVGTSYAPNKIDIYLVGSIGQRVTFLERDTELNFDFLKVLAPSKTRIAIYNIGHFSGGVEKNSTITASDYVAKLAGYKAAIHSINPDVLGIAEYSRIFGKNLENENVETRKVLLADFMGFEGAQANYSCNALFFKTIVDKVKSKDYICNQTAVITHTNLIKATDYYYIDSDLYMHGERIKLVTTHLAFDNNNPAVCSDQIDELISLYADYEKVIFLGDWNVANFSQFDAFINAGYNLANDGTFITYPAGNRALDNIIAKGVTISNPGIIQTTGLSDHLPFYCDINI